MKIFLSAEERYRIYSEGLFALFGISEVEPRQLPMGTYTNAHIIKGMSDHPGQLLLMIVNASMKPNQVEIRRAISAAFDKFVSDKKREGK